MAKFNIDYADRPVKVQSTAAYARPQTDEYEAIARAGQGIFQIGSDLQERKNALEYSEGQRLISEKYNAALESLTGDEEADKQVWETLQSEIDDISYGNSRVNEQISIYRNKLMPQIQSSMKTRHDDLLRQNIHDQFEAEGQTFLAKGELENYQEILKRRLESKDITQAEYNSRIKTMLVDSVLQQARDKIASGNPEQNLVGKKLLQSISSLENATTESKEYALKLASMADKNLDVYSEEANKQLTDLMIQGQLSTDDVMLRRGSLDDSDYESWAKIARQPTYKSGNIIQSTELKSKTMDVWRGTLSRTDLESQIRASLADPNGINEKQYAEIYDDLNREVKAYQAQDSKSYSIEATRLILGKDAGVITFDALGNMSVDVNKLLSPQSEFERKMHYVNMYNKQMADFLSENPKASKKELYVKSQELKATYLAASKGQKTIEDIPRPKTQAEYDALPAGIVYIDTDGQRKRKK